jgi:hypothetical protein
MIYGWEHYDSTVCQNCTNYPLVAYREATKEEEYEIRTIRQLRGLKERYWRPVIARKTGRLGHFGDCECHRALIEGQWTAPCTCGFNYDLRYLGHDLKEKLNPKFWEEYDKQERGIIHPPATEEEKAECDKFLKEHFGEPIMESPEEKKAKDDQEWELIARVFGKDYVEYLKVDL